MQPNAPQPPIPVTILTGYLGAGKTTLLNRLLKSAEMADTAVIVNEFGEVGIDHLLVERADDGIIELSSGCLCCTIRGDLVATLEDLLARADDGRIAQLQRVAIETTGLADPAPILHTVMRHPYLVERYRLDAVVTLVDAVNGLTTLDTAEEAVKQAAIADRIVLTKSDLCDTAERRASLRQLVLRLNALNPAATILDAAEGEATPAALLEAGLWNPAAKRADVGRWLADEALRDRETERLKLEARFGTGFRAGDDMAADVSHAGHMHGPGGEHTHDRNRHDARIRAFALTTERPVSAAAIELFMELMQSAHGPKLLRMKGIVQLAEDPERPLVLHAVQHVMHPPARLPAWPDADRRTRLVFITRDLDERFVSRLFGAFTGDVAPDTPDRAALEHNPLAIAGFSGRFGH
ncbi:MAG: GTP-binding protein [Ancalomicrobiaceae bacterium]|nr:GTP-binding protein [Ancalomicrobiaceae bacterium]